MSTQTDFKELSLPDNELFAFFERNLKTLCETDIEKQFQFKFDFLLESSSLNKDLWMTSVNLSNQILMNIEKLRNEYSSSNDIKKDLYDCCCSFHYLQNGEDCGLYRMYLSALKNDLTEIISILLPYNGRRTILESFLFYIL